MTNAQAHGDIKFRGVFFQEFGLSGRVAHNTIAFASKHFLFSDMSAFAIKIQSDDQKTEVSAYGCRL